MKTNSLPTWSVAVALAATLALVLFLYLQFAPRDASRQELVEIRGNMQRMSQGGPASGVNSPLAPPPSTPGMSEYGQPVRR